MAVKNLYAFTDDGEKVCVASINVPTGYTITIPSDYTPGSHLMISINGGTPQNFATYITNNGRTINNCETLNFTTDSPSTYKVNLGKTYSGSSSDKFYLTWENHWQYGTRTLTSGTTQAEPVAPGSDYNYILMEFIQNISFMYFGITVLEYNPYPK